MNCAREAAGTADPGVGGVRLSQQALERCLERGTSLVRGCAPSLYPALSSRQRKGRRNPWNALLVKPGTPECVLSIPPSPTDRQQAPSAGPLSSAGCTTILWAPNSHETPPLLCAQSGGRVAPEKRCARSDPSPPLRAAERASQRLPEPWRGPRPGQAFSSTLFTSIKSDRLSKR